MSLLSCALLVGLSAVAAPPAETPHPPREVVLKVFLADFEDIPRPETYSTRYFHDLFFGIGAPRATPEGRAIPGSVREYFLNISEGRLDIGGEVADWVRIPRRITRIPHWHGGMEPFGESWPVIVAETLRASGIVGPDAREKLRLADGRMPELLVFLNTDWGVGGVNRGWGHLREVLHTMQLDELWDDAWLDLPSPLSSFSATLWRGAPAPANDGCIDRVPQPSDLELFPLSIMMHEMGHQLAGWPDLYTGAYEPWGVFDLMGGPAASTHFSMTASAFLRESSGWMAYTEMPRESRADCALLPLETHKVALRFPQGPWQESIVCENRGYLVYPGDFGQPPVSKGQGLLLYRLDPAARRILMYGDSPQPKITTVLRRPEGYGEMWQSGEIGAASQPSSRNALGELWWEFRGISTAQPPAITFDAHLAAEDLVEGYTRAEWADADGSPVEAGKIGGDGVQAAIHSPLLDDGAHARRLLLAAPSGGSVRGRYALPADGPRRLYLVARLPETMEAPVTLSAGATGAAAPTTVTLGPEDAGRQRVLVADVPAGAGGVEIALAADPDGPARLELEQAWVVGLPTTVLDLTAEEPERSVVLRDGGAYGPRVLTVLLGGEARAPWRREAEVTAPAGATFRALIGFAAEAPEGARATVNVKLATTDREWPLLTNLTLEAQPDDRARGLEARANLLTVGETPIPTAAEGQTARLVVEITAPEGSPAFRLAMPYVGITVNREAAP